MTSTTGGDTKAEKAQERALARQELARGWRAARSAKERLDLVISAEHGESALRAIAPEELYFTIKDLGLSDARELVQFASASQFKALIDLDAWRKDRFDPSAALSWIRLARTDHDDERYRKKLAALDLEILELLLKTQLKVHDLREDEDPEVRGITYRSPEGRYAVEFLVDGSDYAGLRGLLDDLYAEDPFRTARLLESVRWELPTELEEVAYRWRTARLSDLGFPDLAEALSYWAFVDPDKPVAREAAPPPPSEGDGFFLERFEGKGRFLEKAAALLPEEARPAVGRQLLWALNAALVVEGADPSNAEEVLRVTGAAHDTLSLGLEHASQADPARGAALLAGAPLKRIFQVGASLALQLKFRADRLMRSGKASFPSVARESLFDAPLSEIVAGLRRKRPMAAEVLDPGGAEGKLRPIRDLADRARLSAALEQAEGLAALFERLGLKAAEAERALGAGRPKEALGLLTFSDLFLTAAARALIGEGFVFAPLPAAKLGAWTARALKIEAGQARPTAELEAAVRATLEGAARELGAAAQEAARDLAELCLERAVQEAGAPLLAQGSLESGDAVALRGRLRGVISGHQQQLRSAHRELLRPIPPVARMERDPRQGLEVAFGAADAALLEDGDARLLEERQVVRVPQPVLEVQGRVEAPPRSLREAQEIIRADGRVEERVVVLIVDDEAHGRAGGGDPPALLENGRDVRRRDVLERGGRGNAVDGPGREAGGAGVARGTVVDAEPRLQICRQRAGADGAGRAAREVGRQVHSRDLGQDVVHAAGLREGPDVHQGLSVDAQRPQAEGHAQVVPGAELEEGAVAKRLLEAREDPSQVPQRDARGIPELRLAGGEAARDVSLK